MAGITEIFKEADPCDQDSYDIFETVALFSLELMKSGLWIDVLFGS